MVAPRVLRRRHCAAGAHPAWTAEVVVTWVRSRRSRRQPPEIPRLDATPIQHGRPGGRAGKTPGEAHGARPRGRCASAFGALRNLPPFLQARSGRRARGLTVGQPRFAPRPRAPAGRHAVRRQADHRRGGAPGQAPGACRAASANGWPAAGSTHLAPCSRLEFGLAVLVRRARPRRLAASTRCSPSSSRNATSVRLMEHAATLDLEDFEDSELQDRLERARRQTIGPHDPDEPALRPGAGRGDRS